MKIYNVSEISEDIQTFEGISLHPSALQDLLNKYHSNKEYIEFFMFRYSSYHTQPIPFDLNRNRIERILTRINAFINLATIPACNFHGEIRKNHAAFGQRNRELFFLEENDYEDYLVNCVESKRENEYKEYDDFYLVDFNTKNIYKKMFPRGIR